MSSPASARIRGLERKPPPQNDDIPSSLRMPTLKGWVLEEATVAELQHHFEQRHFSCAEYTKHCIDYIQAVNPYVEAVIEINRDALHIATQMDEERLADELRGPLHGIPVLVKDNISKKDSTHTTAGSWALLGSIVLKEAYVVTRLRDAGAVILGHSNMSEWALLRSNDYSTGYSPRGGQTRNPYNLQKSPFGSSSGSAVAVSANLVPVSLGTETDTSIIGPASANGVVGIKPTVGLTSRAGVIPISENMDSVGPFGRTVADAVAVLDAISGPDPEDAFSTAPGRRQPISYLSQVSDRFVLRGAHVGLPIKDCWDVAPESCTRDIPSYPSPSGLTTRVCL